MTRRSAMTARRQRFRGGFTLIEVIATIVILAAVATAASNILLTAGNGYLDAAGSAQLHSEISMAMDRLVREFRQIDLDNGASGIAPDIDDVTPTSMTWHTDYSVTLNGSVLQLVEDGGAASTLLTDVSKFMISTFDEDNNSLAGTLTGDQCDDIRRIEISIAQSRYGVTDELRAKVFVRSTVIGGGTDPS